MEGGITGKGFKKGQSGNPKGRKHGTRLASTMLKEMAALPLSDNNEILIKLKEKFPTHFKGNEKANIEKVIIMRMLLGCMDGNSETALRFIREYLDRIEGKPKQAVDHTTQGEKLDATPIIFHFVDGTQTDGNDTE